MSAPGSSYENVLLGIAVVVTFVWAVAVMVQVIIPSHPAPQSVNIVMPIVAGGFFGGHALARRRREKEENGNDA